MLADDLTRLRWLAGILACLDGYMNIAMEQTEVRAHSASVHHRTELLWQHQA